MSTALPQAQHLLETQGLYCPEPVMLLHNKIRDVGAGEVVEVRATDPSTQRDIPRFCSFLGHQLLAERHDGELFRYWLRKAGAGE